MLNGYDVDKLMFLTTPANPLLIVECVLMFRKTIRYFRITNNIILMFLYIPFFLDVYFQFSPFIHLLKIVIYFSAFIAVFIRK